MNDNIKELQLEFLKEAAAHYNSSNRCVIVGGSIMGTDVCRYAPVNENTQGCAIGRKLPLEIAELIDKKFPHGASVGSSKVWELIPYELGRLGRNFLGAVQGLHDCKKHWDENGLTDEGKRHYDYIVANFIEQVD